MGQELRQSVCMHNEFLGKEVFGLPAGVHLREVLSNREDHTTFRLGGTKPRVPSVSGMSVDFKLCLLKQAIRKVKEAEAAEADSDLHAMYQRALEELAEEELDHVEVL